MADSFIRQIRAAVPRRDVCYRLSGDVEIDLPGNHPLPRYQRDYPLYDRFLPMLVSRLPDTAQIIDVGANCGDTVAAMYAANPRLRYLAIEPDPAFFKY